MRSIDVDEFADKIGIDSAQAADLDGNGVIDARDIAMFAERQGIPLPERFRRILDEVRTIAVDTP